MADLSSESRQGGDTTSSVKRSTITSSKDHTNTIPEQDNTNRGTAELSEPSPHSAGLTKSIRTGCVAERILQLQAKLSPKKDDLHTSPTSYKSPASPTAGALSRYSISKHLLTPRSIPLPETPARLEADIGQLGKGLRLAQRRTSLITRPNTSGDLDVDPITAGGINEPEEAEKYDTRTEQSQDTGNHLQHKDNTSLRKDLNSQHSHDDLQSSPAMMKDGEGIVVEEMSSSSPLPLRRYRRPPIMDAWSTNTEDSSRIPHCMQHATTVMNTPRLDLDRPQEVRRKSSGTSPGSAYSKILPFILSPSVTSYIPRRQSSTNELNEEVSPARLRKVDSMKITEPVTPGSPRLSPSPRQRDQRSLRRRTFHSKSEDTLRKDLDEIDTKGQDLPLASSTMALEDVFTNPAGAAKPYHPEQPQIAGNNALASPKSLHDIQNPSYIPSVMPRRMGSRQMLQTRHQRSISALNVQKQRSTGLAANLGTKSLVKPIPTDSIAPEPEKNVNMGGSNNPAGTDSFATYDYRPLQRATSPIADQRTYIKGFHQSEEDKAVQMQHSRDLATGMSTGDGPSSNYGCDNYATSRRKFASIVGSSSPCTSTSKIPRPISSSESELGTIRILSARIENTLPARYNPEKTERELKVVLTINQGIQDVIKIEVHPSTKPPGLHDDHNKENRME